MSGCHGCGRPYGDEHGFPDLLIPDAQWRKISPNGDGSGLLCPSCICKRLYDAGVRDCPGAFMSGPIRTVDQAHLVAVLEIERESPPVTWDADREILRRMPISGAQATAEAIGYAAGVEVVAAVRHLRGLENCGMVVAGKAPGGVATWGMTDAGIARSKFEQGRR